jgi:hypothetical protein
VPDEMKLEVVQIKSTRIEPTKSPPPTKQPTVKSLTGKVAEAVKGEPAKEPEAPRPQAPRFEYALTIEGSAASNNDVADFLASLKASPVFDKVEMPFIREQRDGDRDVRKFQITAVVRADMDTQALGTSLRQLVATRTREVTGQTGEIAGADDAGPVQPKE